MSAHGLSLTRAYQRCWRRAARLILDPRVWRFSVVGLVGAGVNTLALQLIHGVLRLPLVLASVMATELAIANNYVLNEVWTFGSRQASLLRFTKFNATALVALSVNVTVVWALDRLGIFYLVGNAFGIAAAMGINLAVSATWIWGGKKDGVVHLRGPGGDLSPAERPGGAHLVPDDLHLGPAAERKQRGPRTFRRSGPVLHRDSSGSARRRGHRDDRRPDRAQ
ncbi:putative flippase GtrA [Actinopolymorpha cephalotaxi]|uniref:Flippase GtrA n=1 Tax=Actinopolymorpha cephalotaxi TaxID=504797 RepID=A0ABX2S857_9ACTN|nr:putative flippase GtrA [Actinopolymorpha cephalotaxi]